MASREEILMSMKAQAPQDLDMKQVLQALAGAAVQGGPSTSWGYGMKVDDAQKEGALARQHQQELNTQLQQAKSDALAQETDMRNRAVQAHSMAMQEKQLEQYAANLALQRENLAYYRALNERKLALQEQMYALERRYKEVRTDKDETAMRLLDARREKLELETEGTRAMIAAGIYGIGQGAKGQQAAFSTKALTGLGYSDAGAQLLIQYGLKNFGDGMQKAKKTFITAHTDKFGRQNFGTKDVDGKPTQITADEAWAAYLPTAVSSLIPSLPDADKRLLIDGILGKQPQTAEVPQVLAPVETDPEAAISGVNLSPEAIDILARTIQERYSRPR